VSDAPIQTTETHTETTTTSDEVVNVNGKIHVEGLWTFLVWLLSPFQKSGPALILTTGIIVFVGYEIDRIRTPLIEKYGAYVDGQTAFTATVKAGMESQKQATEDVKMLAMALKEMVEQNGVRIEADAAATILMAEEGTVPARAVQKLMIEATQLMRPVPAMRAEENRIMAELLGVQKDVLKTLQDSAKNVPTPPSRTNGGA
jgi:hypothetical protein